MKKEPQSSADLRAQLAREGRPVIVAFSRGKDAIAALLALREAGCEVRPYHLDLVPGLRFVDESCAELERVLGVRVLRMPHPSLYRWIRNHVFRPPEQCAMIEKSLMWSVVWEYSDVYHAARVELDAPDAWIATGVRAADSPIRRVSLITHGPTSKERLAHVVWDWKADDVEGIIRRHGVRLPIDYRLFGRTFDGLDARFLGPMREHLPDDYATVLRWFPLAETDLLRGVL